MKPEDAVVLDNFIPTESGVKSRKGSDEWVTGLDNAVETLMVYSPESGSDEMFAAAGAEFFDVTLQKDTLDQEGQPLGLLFALTQSGEGSVSVVASLSNARWQHTMFSNSGSNYLIACNGADAVKAYEGTTWSEPNITGVAETNLINVTSHMERLWFVEKDSQSIWYLPTGAIAGAATEIDFSAISKLGGSLIAMASWTRDGGSGMDDLAVFLTDKGEAHIYQGIDPSSTTTWQRVGTFRIPRPIGFRCVTRVGADVAIITEQGVLPLSAILPLAASTQSKTAATERIQDAFSNASSGGFALTGWQVIENPSDQLLVVNVPTISASEAVQYVMNTVTRKWCRFTGFSAASWALFNGDLYFGDWSGTVWKHTGTTDNGEPIVCKSVSAFNSFGSPLTKSFRRVRAQFFAPIGFAPTVGLRLDFGEDEQLYTGVGVDVAGSEWDLATWDASPWSQGSVSTASWKSITGEGFTAALVVETSSTEQITYNGSKILLEVGNAL